MKPFDSIATLMLVLAACLTLATDARGQADLGFESEDPLGEDGGAWRVEASASVTLALDTAASREGARSLRIASSTSDGRARVAQAMAPGAIAGNRLRISAHARAGTAGASAASLWVRVEGPRGFLYIDRGRRTSTDERWTRYEVQAPLSRLATRIRFGLDVRGAGTTWIDDFEISSFDAATLPPPSPAARRYVDRALDVMQRNSMRRVRIDWPDFRAAAMEQARGAASIEEAYLALRFALGELADGHSYLMTSGRMRELGVEPVSNARTLREPREPRGELIAGSAGYLWIPGFAGGSHRDQAEFAGALQRTIARLDRTKICGWIVDLRSNSGGNLWPMLAGVGPLLGDGTAGAAVYPDGTRTEHWYREGRVGLGEYVQLRVRGEAYRLRRHDAPVAVLTDRSTASAGELLAVAFRGRPDTASFGRPTRGVSTATRIFPLSDGAALVLAVAETRDRHGTAYPGPIVPDQVVTATGRERGGRGERRAQNVPLGRQPDIQAAMDWLHAHPACQRHSDALESANASPSSAQP